MIAFRHASGPTRTTTPSISSSIAPADRSALRSRHRGRGANSGGVSTTTGTKRSKASPHRQPAQTPARLPATAEQLLRTEIVPTTRHSPSQMSVSSTMRALSSADRRRRPPAPVISSRRRTRHSGSNVSSSPGTSRSPIRDREPTSRRLWGKWSPAPLSLQIGGLPGRPVGEVGRDRSARRVARRLGRGDCAHPPDKRAPRGRGLRG